MSAWGDRHAIPGVQWPANDVGSIGHIVAHLHNSTDHLVSRRDRILQFGSPDVHVFVASADPYANDLHKHLTRADLGPVELVELDLMR